jgi:hypothetical protein
MKTLANDRDLDELRQRYLSLCGEEQPLFGKMSAGAAVCHVREAYRSALEGRPMTAAVKFPLPPVLIKLLALRMPMKWQPGIKTVAELEPGQPGTVPAEFAADKAALLAELDRFRVAMGEAAHPYFGKMSRADWLRWGYLHADHHLRQFGR